MNYIKTQAFLSIFFDIIKKLKNLIIIFFEIFIFFTAASFGLLVLVYYNIILMPILFILSFTIKDCPKEIKLGMVFIMLTQVYLVYQAIYYPDFFAKTPENIERMFLLELYSYLLNISLEINDSLLAASTVIFFTIPAPFIVSSVIIESITQIKKYISKHKQIAQEKFESLSNHEKLLKIK